MKSPSLYCFLLSILTDFLPVPAAAAGSLAMTRNTAECAEAYVKFCAIAYRRLT